jgi:glycine C-acetyltransferase
MAEDSRGVLDPGPMPHERLDPILADEVESLRHTGTAKGSEAVIVGVEKAAGRIGPRYLLEGESRSFVRMNSNGYLGLSQHPAVIEAEEVATKEFGAGPGAVRFISGTYRAHVELEERLAGFHGRPASVIFSSAYAAVVSTLTSLITSDTVVFSDELNHNCIINALRLARPAEREVYPHLDYPALDSLLTHAAGKGQRAIVVTDGVFSMRGDYADLAALMTIARDHDGEYAEGVVLVVDDSHGVAAFGETGRGTEEVTGAGAVDILIGTLGKAFGVNGGYVAGSQALGDFLREKAPMYIYSNPITVGEAAAASTAVSIVDSAEGRSMLSHLSRMTSRFESGLVDLGLETIPGPHPVVPLMVRDTERTAALVSHLYDNGVLATGLNYPVVPKGDEEIRFQVNADHTEADIDEVLSFLAR